jgi:hypothetical protein
VAVLTIGLNFAQFVSKIRHESNIMVWLQAIMTEQYGAPMAASTGLRRLQQYIFVLFFPLIAIVFVAVVAMVDRAGIVGRIQRRWQQRGMSAMQQRRPMSDLGESLLSPAAPAIDDADTKCAIVDNDREPFRGGDNNDLQADDTTDDKYDRITALEHDIVEIRVALYGLKLQWKYGDRSIKTNLKDTKKELKRAVQDLAELHMRSEEIVNVPPFAKFVQCAVLILVYTFTQTLTYCCLAFRPLTIYEDSVHEQQRLAFIPDIVWFGEDGEHKTMMAWSVACLLLWVVSTPLILCLFIFGGDRVLPTVLRGASGRFLKAHYRPGKQGFELVYMFRRIALTCAAILITNETGELAAINGILFLSGVLHFWQRPFKKWTHNYLEAASVMLLFFLYDTQVYLSAFVGPETEDTVTTLLDVVEVLGFVLIFPFIVSDMGPMLRRWCGCCCGRKNREEHQDLQRSSVADERKGGTILEFSDRRSLDIGCADAAGEKKSDQNNTATADNSTTAAAAATEEKNKQDDTDTDISNVAVE